MSAPSDPATPAPDARHEARISLFATVALIAMTATWGSTFFLIKDLLDRVPTLDFLAVRFAIASATMLLIAPKAIARLSPQVRRHAIVLGCLYGGSQILQTAGLAHTAASVSGFITGMYVVCTPLLAAVLLKQRIAPLTWFAVILAMVGLGVLSLQGFALGYGELLTLAAAVGYALHIVGLGAWSNPKDALGMSMLQLMTITVICFVATAPNGVVLPQTTADWVSMVYMAVFAAALAMLAQTWAQAHLSPTRAAIIMSMEPVFAAAFAVLFAAEPVTGRLLIGGSMMLAAMLIVELLPRRKVEAEVTHLTV